GAGPRARLDHLDARSLLALQRIAGNRAVAELVQRDEGESKSVAMPRVFVTAPAVGAVFCLNANEAARAVVTGEPGTAVFPVANVLDGSGREVTTYYGVGRFLDESGQTVWRYRLPVGMPGDYEFRFHVTVGTRASPTVLVAYRVDNCFAAEGGGV